MPIQDFARYPLLFGPSPVHPLERLTAHLGGAAIWAKREDCNSGIAYGGNKTRKLEYLVADALAKGCDTLVSIGGVQSNHTRQVAAVAARRRAEVRARAGELGRLAGRRLRQGRQHPAQPARRGRRPAGQGRVRDRLQGELGAGAARTSRSAAASRTRSRPAPPTTRWAASASRTGRTRWPSRSASSASSSTRSIVCSVTGSTQAGHGRRLRRAGARPARRPRRVLGIDASAKPAETREQIAPDRPPHRRADRRPAGAARGRRRARRALPRGRRTASPTSTTLDAMRLAARTEGMITDPVYEGKSMAGADRPRVPRRDRPRRDRALRATSAASPRSTATARCSPDATAPAPSARPRPRTSSRPGRGRSSAR